MLKKLVAVIVFMLFFVPVGGWCHDHGRRGGDHRHDDRHHDRYERKRDYHQSRWDDHRWRRHDRNDYHRRHDRYEHRRDHRDWWWKEREYYRESRRNWHHDDWANFATGVAIGATVNALTKPPRPSPLCKYAQNHFDWSGRYTHTTYYIAPCRK